ncbi:MAG: transcription antitermination factor NusB [Planctomycetota bacterium]
MSIRRNVRPQGPAPLGPRRIAARALLALAEDPDARLDAVLDLDDLPARDRGLAATIARGVVRRQGFLDHVLAGHCDRGLPDDPRMRIPLRIGAFQLMFLERVPPHAAVDESVALSGPRQRGFINAVLRRVAASVQDRPADPARPRDEVALGEGRSIRLAAPIPDPGTDPAGALALVHGLPEFLVARWIDDAGVARARARAAAADGTPGVTFRPVGISASELAERLAAAGVETAPSEHPHLLSWVQGSGSPFRSAPFEEGLFVVQDPTAFRAAQALDAQAGETILDLCAAPGTKATWLAEAVGKTGRVLAHDIDVTRRQRIAENAARLRMPWLEVCESVESLAGPIDRVLVDVPCSNTGVLARRVEVRHRLEASAFERLPDLQTDLLLQGLALVRPGGTVVYSTCSIEPDENQDVVAAALAARGEAVELVTETLTEPDPPRHDGGYLAVLRVRPEARN